jgi:hypothetical protein
LQLLPLGSVGHKISSLVETLHQILAKPAACYHCQRIIAIVGEQTILHLVETLLTLILGNFQLLGTSADIGLLLLERPWRYFILRKILLGFCRFLGYLVGHVDLVVRTVATLGMGRLAADLVIGVAAKLVDVRQLGGAWPRLLGFQLALPRYADFL